jgi:hypothetical protein
VLENDSKRYWFEITLPSGNFLAFDCLGGRDADRVLLHGVHSGDGRSPARLDLVVPDPDTADGGDENSANAVHRIRVRHHGPTDVGRAALPPDFVEEGDYPLGEEANVVEAGSKGNRLEIRLPSGNSLVFHYLGGRDVDRIVLHGIDSGNGSSPANLYLVVPDPDTADDDHENAANAVHRVRVRHHGPTDSERAAFPADFAEESDSIEEDDFTEEDDLIDKDDCLEA